jgi:hypothetical protein
MMASSGTSPGGKVKNDSIWWDVPGFWTKM